jgi:preprotein translocase subunit SecY
MIALLVCLAVVTFAVVVLLVARARHATQCARAREQSAAEPRSIHVPLLLSLASLVAVGPMGAILLTLFPPMQSLFADLACPSGWSIVATSSTVGASTYHGGMCSHGDQWQELSSLFPLACGAFVAALAALVGLSLSGRRWLAERQRQDWLLKSQ